MRLVEREQRRKVRTWNGMSSASLNQGSCTRSCPFGSHDCQVHCGPGEDAPVAARFGDGLPGAAAGSWTAPLTSAAASRRGDTVYSVCQLVGADSLSLPPWSWPALSTCSANKRAGISKMSFSKHCQENRALFPWPWSRAQPQRWTMYFTPSKVWRLWGPAAMPLCGPRSAWPGCLLLRLSLRGNLADDSICPFYFRCAWQLITGAARRDLWCLRLSKENLETATDSTLLPRSLRLSPIHLYVVPNASHPAFFSSGVFVFMLIDWCSFHSKGIKHL